MQQSTVQAVNDETALSNMGGELCAEPQVEDWELKIENLFQKFWLCTFVCFQYDRSDPLEEKSSQRSELHRERQNHEVWTYSLNFTQHRTVKLCFEFNNLRTQGTLQVLIVREPRGAAAEYSESVSLWRIQNLDTEPQTVTSKI